MIFIDEASGLVTAFFIKTKVEAPKIMKRFSKWLKIYNELYFKWDFYSGGKKNLKKRISLVADGIERSTLVIVTPEENSGANGRIKH